MNRKEHARTTSTGNQKTILLVDDDPSVREMVGRVLTGEGYLVLTAANGPEALRIAASTAIDLVLLDLNMPGQSGWDTFERLTSGNPLLAIVIITARSQQLFTAVNAGTGALLEKPLDYPKMLQTIRDLLAESPETRITRLTGKRADFHYLPSKKREPPE
ncbi:MAG TPA: response regulator [Verrucomicrobiae bacterium]|nr:response regulator [Verrucomicrobiae bacterium]